METEDLEGLTPEGLIALENRYGEDAVQEATIAYLCSRKRWHGGRFALEVNAARVMRVVQKPRARHGKSAGPKITTSDHSAASQRHV